MVVQIISRALKRAPIFENVTERKKKREEEEETVEVVPRVDPRR